MPSLCGNDLDNGDATTLQRALIMRALCARPCVPGDPCDLTEIPHVGMITAAVL